MAEEPINLATTADEGWSDTRKQALRQHFRLGLSAGESATLLDMSRSAVMGARGRLGLRWPADEAKVRRDAGAAKAVLVRADKRASTPKRPKAPPVARQVAITVPLPKLRAFAVSGEPVGILDLCPIHCRWPVAIKHDEHLFCAAEREGDGPYCSRHRGIAYVRPILKPRAKAEPDLLRHLRRSA